MNDAYTGIRLTAIPGPFTEHTETDTTTGNAFFDVFPLSEGLLTTYQYKETYVSWFYSSHITTKDSGIVEYFVTDSSVMNDSTIVWLVHQKLNLLHWIYRQSPPFDTIYSIVDSSFTTLTEFTTRRHELQCSIHTWSFPTLFGIPVFRFSESPQTLIEQKFSNCMTYADPTNYDSLWFSVDSGLTCRIVSQCIDNDDWGSAFWRNSRLISRTLASTRESNALPKQSVLFSNYPNPFNPSTIFKFRISNFGFVSLKIYDILGREVAKLVNEVMQPGEYSVKWDASNNPSGVYYYRLITGDFAAIKKMVLLR
jgi:hypothetical protein